MFDSSLTRPTVWRSLRPFGVACLSLFLTLPASLFAQSSVVLTNLAQVRASSLTADAQGIPVSVRATVTYIDPSWQMLFVQDDTGASFVESSVPVGDPSWNLQVGEIVQVDGITSPGLVQCNVRERTLQSVGQGKLPTPLDFGNGDTAETNFDAHWVKVTGAVTGVQASGRRLTFTLRVAPRKTISLAVLQGNPVSAATLIGCAVEAVGACGVELDSSNRPTGGNVLWISDLAAIQKNRVIPTTSIASLSAATETNSGLVRIRGNVISQSPGDFLFVRDDSGSVRVNSSARNVLAVGSPVEIFAYQAAQNGSVILEDATIIPSSPPPETLSSNGLVALPTADGALPTLTQTAQVRGLPATDAALRYPVKVTGVLTYSDNQNGIQFIQDRSGGIFIDGGGKKFDAFPDATHVVEVTGFSGPGDYAPVILAQQMRDLGEAALPKPKSVSIQTLLTGSQDSQWVALNGVIRSQTKRDNNTIGLALATGDSIVEVVVPGASEHPAPRNFVDSWVEVRGVCGSLFDDHRHLQGIRLFVPNWDQLRTWSDGPNDPFALPARSISELLEFHPAADGLHRSHVRGAVSLRHADGSFYVQDATGSILIQPVSARGVIEPGRMVDLVGFPSIVNQWPVLQEADVRATGEVAKTRPAVLAPDAPLNSTAHGALVQLRARVMAHSTSATQESLMLQFGPWITDAILEKEKPADQLGEIEPGATVNLTGVYLARLDQDQKVQSFQLQLRSPNDVQVLSAPSFWTAQRALWLFGALATALGLVSTWVTLLRKQVHERTRALRAEIEERKRMEGEIAKTHKDLLVASRGAGMAEVATSVLHNVGNVLNSVNVSANLIVDATKSADLSGLTKVSALVREHANDLPAFLTENPKGRQLPKYLELLAERHQTGQQTVLAELESLTRNINHINDIVSMQQNYAKAVGVTEIIPVTTLVEDALQMNRDALNRHDVNVLCDFESDLPDINIDKHKTLQILVNLISNARLACQESGQSERRLSIRVFRHADRVRIAIADNGVGIPPENMTRIFSHGFTTRKHGHGFGLHSGALAAKELGGSLTARSDGPGKGAEFTLDLPLHPSSEKAALSANLAQNGDRTASPELGVQSAAA